VEPADARWLITWKVTNVSAEPLVLEDAWIPHGRFRGEGHVRLEMALPPEATSAVQLRVSAQEPPGTVVKNAFLILRVSGRRRVFARMRIEFGEMPRPIVEAVTMQSLQSEE
jgi:hypothetical protein